MQKFLLGLFPAIMLLVVACDSDSGLESPKVDFQFETEGGKVTFLNQSINCDSYQWDFGDNKTSTEKSPVHIYTEEGTYEVTLSANADGELLLAKKIIVYGDAEANQKVKVIFNEASEVSMAGFKASWTKSNVVAGSYAELFIQIAKDENFEDKLILENYSSETDKSLLKVYESTEHYFKDLDSDQNYWYRMFVKNTFAGTTTTYFSEPKQVVTLPMTAAGEITINEFVSNGNYLYFEVLQPQYEVSDSYSIAPEKEIIVSFDKTFSDNTQLVEKVGHLFNAYVKEPGSKVFVKYIVSWKDKKLEKLAEIEFPFNYITSFANSEGESGNYTKKYSKNGKTMFEFGQEESSERVVFQIADFNGVGKYALKHNTLYMSPGNDINTVDDTYAYFLDEDDIKYDLSRANLSLNVYKETEVYYYCKVEAVNNEIVILNFFEDRDSNHAYKKRTYHDTMFRVEK